MSDHVWAPYNKTGNTQNSRTTSFICSFWNLWTSIKSRRLNLCHAIPMLCFISFPDVSRDDICCPGVCIQKHFQELLHSALSYCKNSEVFERINPKYFFFLISVDNNNSNKIFLRITHFLFLEPLGFKEYHLGRTQIGIQELTVAFLLCAELSLVFSYQSPNKNCWLPSRNRLRDCEI